MKDWLIDQPVNFIHHPPSNTKVGMSSVLFLSTGLDQFNSMQWIGHFKQDVSKMWAQPITISTQKFQKFLFLKIQKFFYWKQNPPIPHHVIVCPRGSFDSRWPFPMWPFGCAPKASSMIDAWVCSWPQWPDRRRPDWPAVRVRWEWWTLYEHSLHLRPFPCPWWWFTKSGSLQFTFKLTFQRKCSRK